MSDEIKLRRNQTGNHEVVDRIPSAAAGNSKVGPYYRNKGGAISFGFQSDSGVKLISRPFWIQGISVGQEFRGTGITEIPATVNSNLTDASQDARSGEVVFSDLGDPSVTYSFTVFQEAGDFRVEPTETHNVPAAGGTYAVRILFSGRWTTHTFYTPEVIDRTPVSGTGPATVIVTVHPNTTGEERVGELGFENLDANVPFIWSDFYQNA